MKKEIQYYDFKEGLPHEIEVLSFSHLFDNFYDHITKPHRAEFYQILWFEKGTATHFIDFNPVEVKPNTLVFVSKGSVQTFDGNASYAGKMILFTPHFFSKTDYDAQFLSSTLVFNDLLTESKLEINSNNLEILEIFHQIEKELQRENDGYQADISRNFLRNFLLFAERERKQQNFIEIQKDANFELAIAFKNSLEIHFIKQKHVAFYCDKLNCTQKKLNSATTLVFGKSPKGIISERLLLEAKRLLVYNTHTVKEISFQLGFEEPTNFIKFFKKQTQITPAEFRIQNS